MIFRQLFDPATSAFSYLIADPNTGAASLIDPVFGQVERDAALIAELDLKLLWTLETHVHADHVTGAWALKEKMSSKIAVAKASGALDADRYLIAGDTIDVGNFEILVRATPGHTAGCLTFVLADLSAAFTGDCLLIRGTGRSDFQGGDAATLYHSVHDQIFSLPDHCLLYPGHDYHGLTVTSVAEEKRYNPRLGGGVGLDDFITHMASLNLPPPKQIDIAAPANKRCGRPA